MGRCAVHDEVYGGSSACVRLARLMVAEGSSEIGAMDGRRDRAGLCSMPYATVDR